MKALSELTVAAITLLGIVLPASAADSQVLPWQREMSLREAARSVALESTLQPTNPLPDSGGFGVGRAMTINNLKMRTTLWADSGSELFLAP